MYELTVPKHQREIRSIKVIFRAQRTNRLLGDILKKWVNMNVFYSLTKLARAMEEDIDTKFKENR